MVLTPLLQQNKDGKYQNESMLALSGGHSNLVYKANC